MRNIGLFLALGIAVASTSWLVACSEEDDTGKGPTGGQQGSTGGAPGTGGSPATGGSPSGDTCGAQNIPSSCANAEVVLNSCVGCHSAATAGSFKTLDFLTNPKEALLGKPALYTTLEGNNQVPGCPSTPEVLLSAENFDTSLFVTKTRGSGFACGAAMPWLASPLSEQDRDCLLAWACGLTK